MADLNSTIVRGKLRVTQDEYISGNLDVAGTATFTGVVPVTPTIAGVQIGRDSGSSHNSHISIATGGSASYIDFGPLNSDFSFRIIKWEGINDNFAQFYYDSNKVISIPKASGTLALTSQFDNYLPLSGGTLTSGNAGILELKRNTSGGAFIDYLNNNQTTNWWRVGSDAENKFSMYWQGSTNVFNVTSSGNTSIAGTLGVTGATTLSSTLTTSGQSTFNGKVNINPTLAEPGSYPSLSINFDINNGEANLGTAGLNMIKFGTVDNYIGQVPPAKSDLNKSTMGIHSKYGFDFLTTSWTKVLNLASSGVLTLYTPNTWLSPSKLQLGRTNENKYSVACVGVTDGNLHIDAYPGKDIFLNYYQATHGKIYFGGSTYYINSSGYFNGKSENSNKLNGQTADYYATATNDLKARYNLGAFDTCNGYTITRQTGYLKLAKASFSKDGNYWYIPSLGTGFSSSTAVMSNVEYGYSQNSTSYWQQSGAGYIEVYAPDASNSADVQLLYKNTLLQYKLPDAQKYTETVIQNQTINIGDVNQSLFLNNEFKKSVNLWKNSNITGYPANNVTHEFVGDSEIKCSNISGNDPYMYVNINGFVVGQIYTLQIYTSEPIQYATCAPSGSRVSQAFPYTFKATKTEYEVGVEFNPNSSATQYVKYMLTEGEHTYPYQVYNGPIVHQKDLVDGYLPLTGGTMTGSIGFNSAKHIRLTTTGSTGCANYISAGAGYGNASGLSGVKVACCDDGSIQTGLGQDLNPNGYGYNFCLVNGNSSSDIGHMSFVSHKVGALSTYRELADLFDNAGTISFTVNGSITGKTLHTSGTSYNATLGEVSDSWNNQKYVSLYGNTSHRWVMHFNPHIVDYGKMACNSTVDASCIRMENRNASSPGSSTFTDIYADRSGNFGIYQRAANATLFELNSTAVTVSRQLRVSNNGDNECIRLVSDHSSGYINMNFTSTKTTEKWTIGRSGATGNFYIGYNNGSTWNDNQFVISKTAGLGYLNNNTILTSANFGSYAAAKYEWDAVVSASTWSRLCTVYNSSTTGGTYFFTVKGTRGSVVFQGTFLVQANHWASGFSSLLLLASSNYSAATLRAVANQAGDTTYIELYDDANSFTSGTQTVNCSLIPITTVRATPTLYTEYTAGGIPSGWTSDSLSFGNEHKVATNNPIIAGNLYATSTVYENGSALSSIYQKHCNGSATSFDDALTDGEYTFDSGCGGTKPKSGDQWGKLIVKVNDGGTHNNSSNWIWQTAYLTEGQGIYFRGKTNNGGWTGWNRLAFTGESQPASDVYTWAKASSKPSYTHNEIGQGNIVIGDASNTYYYRTATSLHAGFYYHSSGDESVVFANQYEGAGWMFVNSVDPDNRTNWQNLTPTLQIKRGGVLIGKLCGQGSTPSYKLDINGSAAASSFYASSDRRLKDNIIKSDLDCLDIINKLKLKEFNFKDQENKDDKYFGLIAQQLLKTLPDKYKNTMVSQTKDKKHLMSINEGKVQYITMGAVQQLSKKCDQQQKQIDKLTQENKELKSTLKQLIKRLEKLENQ